MQLKDSRLHLMKKSSKIMKKQNYTHMLSRMKENGGGVTFDGAVAK